MGKFVENMLSQIFQGSVDKLMSCIVHEIREFIKMGVIFVFRQLNRKEEAMVNVYLSFLPQTLVRASVLTSKKISLEKLDFIRVREEFLMYSFQIFFVPSLFKASSSTVKNMHIRIESSGPC